MKNIILCCDGTGNEYGTQNSNVIKLYQGLKRDNIQLTYYHPGVGTMGDRSALTWIGKTWTKVRGLAFGYGLSDNIADAYRFLMQTYEAGDKVFIFGFSRGAYTARALCGMLEMVGILARGNEGLIPYAIRLFKRNDDGVLARFRSRPSKFRIAAGFKKTFASECKPHFLGIWDTVSSVGWILDPIGLKPGSLPFTYELNEVSAIRHAVSIDERRAFFRQNLVSASHPDLKQVWFAGVHSDVGGSYPEEESGLSKISLKWMFREAHNAGLLLDQSCVNAILGDDLIYSKPLANAVMHNSLSPRWWIGEFWPKFTRKRVPSPTQPGSYEFRGRPRVNLFRRRSISDGSCIHESVFKRKQLVADYNPTNLPTMYAVEPDLESEPYPTRLQCGQSHTVLVHSKLKWNDTTLSLKAGERYLFESNGRWYDAHICSGPAGYPSPSLVFRLLEPFRRCSRENWFALVGAVGQGAPAALFVGPTAESAAQGDGILLCYANDLPFMYFNNSGWVRLTVTRLS